MQAFDHFIIIDWSSRNRPSPARPSKDAIWVGEGTATGRVTTRYFRTRQTCIDFVTRRLERLHKAGKRVLVGWDFVLGYPKGLAKALKIKKKPAWYRIWKLISRLTLDHSDNTNNRFTVGAELNRRISVGSGPFWGVPIGQSGIFLGAKKDFSYPVINKRAVLAEKRLVELRVPKMQPGWKLAYAGSVGSQALLGIPRVHELCFGDNELATNSYVWPFETKFAKKLPEGAVVVHAEIYPSMLPLTGKDKITDRAQVRTYVKWLQSEQASGSLADWLSGPAGLTKQQRKRVLRHEGWVLGVK
ncbi:hypothetical protein [Neolewinella persica]|uniref:hypothetical protein n=1 Tax=Neolewinella persica TaxID=70998 RepID=UPI0003817D65|nr:hypothetical protein [Neolewinella persica]